MELFGIGRHHEAFNVLYSLSRSKEPACEGNTLIFTEISL
jgi:hypothetical protein